MDLLLMRQPEQDRISKISKNKTRTRKEDAVQQAPQTDASPYIYRPPATASFTGKGFLGYAFGPLRKANAEFLYIESEKGHDTFFISKTLTRLYYILEGTGHFNIGGTRYPVGPGMLVEVPPKVEFTYSGKMNMIALGTPRWRRGNETTTRWNPDVVDRDTNFDEETKSGLTRLVRMRIFGKSPVGAYLRVNQRVWSSLPASLTALGPVRAYGSFLNKLAKRQMGRAQAFSTYFIRNRSELELISRLLQHRGKGETVRVAVLGCSTGAEAYSIAWKIRSSRSDLKLVMNAVDISRQAVEFGERGVYSLLTPELTDTSICSAMTKAEVEGMLERNGNSVVIRPWLKEGITWKAGDAGDPNVADELGLHDMVVANNFLCHMQPADAKKCLLAIARLVRPGGYLFVSGVDLDVRTEVISELGWQPVQDMLEEIHEADRSYGARWPCHYAGIEPLHKGRNDWKLRYAAVHRSIPAEVASTSQKEEENDEASRTVGASPGPR